MKFTVYQINLSENELNNPFIQDQVCEIMFKPDAEIISKMKSFYKEVAEVEANDFEDVFQIGNIGPEERITRKAPMHSVSVGDVILCEDGACKFVDKIGFGEVCFKG
jgi:hypothetical protein